MHHHKFSAVVRKKQQNHTRTHTHTYIPLLPTAISGVDIGDKSNVVAQSVSGNVLITYRWHSEWEEMKYYILQTVHYRRSLSTVHATNCTVTDNQTQTNQQKNSQNKNITYTTNGQRIMTIDRIAACRYGRWNDPFLCIPQQRLPRFSIKWKTPKNCPFPGSISSQPNTWILGPTEVTA